MYIAPAAVLVVSLGSPLLFKPLLHRMGVVDVPNIRSSHSRPVIRGMGLAPLLATVIGYSILFVGGRGQWALALLITIVSVSVSAALLGLIEDLRGVQVAVRAGVQLAIGFAGAAAIVVLTGAPLWLVPLFAVGVAAYINVANFMDGVDAISGLHAIVVGSTYAILGQVVREQWLLIAGVILALSFAGFLPWNLIRGGMFLGDVGSYLLGGGIGIIAVAAIARGVPPIAVLGPVLIYLTDAGGTLLRRVLRRERWHEAHRTHVYQRLAMSGLSHVEVSLIVTGASACTGALGLYGALMPNAWLLAVALLLLVAAGYFSLGAVFARRYSRRCSTEKKAGIR